MPVIAPTIGLSDQATQETDGTVQARIEVELDIFSGMPNPTWTLTGDDVGAFLNHLESLRHTRVAIKLSGNLGYRGFVIRVTTEPHGQQLIRIQSGNVQISEGATTTHAEDEGRRLERWLVTTGRPHLTPDIFNLVAEAIH